MTHSQLPDIWQQGQTGSRGVVGRDSEIKFPETMSSCGHPLFYIPSAQVLPPTGVSAEMEVTVPGCSMPAG